MPGKWAITEVAAIDGSSASSYTYTLNDYEGYVPIGVSATLTLGVSSTSVAFYLESYNSLSSSYQLVTDAAGGWAFGVSSASTIDTLRVAHVGSASPSHWPIPPTTNLVVDVGGLAAGNIAQVHLILANPFGG